MRKVSLFIGTLAAMVAFLGLSAPVYAIPPIDLLTDANVRIDGAPSQDIEEGVSLGNSVAGAGDVNNDGIPDVILGVPTADYGGEDSGSAYVIFGQRSTTTIELDDLGNRGFRIDGAEGGLFGGINYPQGDRAGTSVDGVGDLNDDGRADVIVGAPSAKHNRRVNSGSAYVVFGKSSTDAVNLKDFGTADGPDREKGFRIDGAVGGSLEGGDRAGTSVAGADDVNDDGTPDLIVGAPHASNNNRFWSGSAYVVFGKSSTTTIDLANLGSGGFRIDGAAGGGHFTSDQAGTSVSGAGDMNDDGKADVIVGASLADNNGREDSGSAYVIFGKAGYTTTVDLANVGRPGNTEGLRIDGARGSPAPVYTGDEAGYSVSGAGDMNDDGKADVVVGAPGAWSGGSAYVVFGKASYETVDLVNFDLPGNEEGFRIRNDGTATGLAGTSVSDAGDVNGDGTPDVIVGAPGTNVSGGVSSAYIVFGKASTQTVDLVNFGQPGNLEGFRMNGPAATRPNFTGTSVAGAGDMDGDGKTDVVIGSPEHHEDPGMASVVFGHASTATVELGDLGTPDGPDRDRGYRIDGTTRQPSQWGEGAGKSVAGAGDVNGDGREDVIIGAPLANPEGRRRAGSAYVVFGQESLSTVDLKELGRNDCPACTPGFRIDGEETFPLYYGFTGISVAGAGDVNDDGLDDVIVGAVTASHLSPDISIYTGSAYVVFGSASTETVDLAHLGDRGFRMDGADNGDGAGNSVAGVGDLNGDDRADVVVGAPGVGNNGRWSSGSAYVVFGKSSTATVALGDLGTPDGPDRDKGYRIDGAVGAAGPGLRGNSAGFSVAGVGDMNDDGKPEVVVGAPLARNNDRVESGSIYVVFGKSSTDTIDLAQLGSGGFRIDGARGCNDPPYCFGDLAGYSVAGSGDVNGDGKPDLIVGAPYADNNGRENSGSAYVVFGKSTTDTVDLLGFGDESCRGGPSCTDAGFRIDGAAEGVGAGTSVAGGGDMNGDGERDVIVSAPEADRSGSENSGSAYVVFGKSSTDTFDLNDLGSGGFQMTGISTSISFSWLYDVGIYGPVAGAGDFNGDGHPDVIVGSGRTDNNGRPDSGSAYIVYGFGPESVKDPDCDGDPFNNERLVRRFAVETSPSTPSPPGWDDPQSPNYNSSVGVSSLTLRGLVCSTALGSSNTGTGTITDHVDFMLSKGSHIYKNASIGGDLQNGAYAGYLVGRLAYHDASGNPQIRPTTATIKVDELDLRWLSHPFVQPADGCNRDADNPDSGQPGHVAGRGLVGNAPGTDGSWNPGELFSPILSCFKVTGSITGSPDVKWHAWLWKTLSGGSTGSSLDQDFGRQFLTLGPIHLNDDPTPNDPNDAESGPPAGLTYIGIGNNPQAGGLVLCANAGAVGGTSCGSSSRPKLHRNGPASVCPNGIGRYDAVATRKDGARTPDFFGPDVANACVVWSNPRGKECNDYSISKKCLLKREGIKRRR